MCWTWVLGEPRRGKGGTDRIIEVKVYNSLVPGNATPDTGCSLRGDTHTFGNTEEYLIRQNKGVKARLRALVQLRRDGEGAMTMPSTTNSMRCGLSCTMCPAA